MSETSKTSWLDACKTAGMLTLSQTDEIEVRSLVDTMAQSWARGDGEGFAAAFTDDADFVNMMAQPFRGRAEIARHHTQLFATLYKGTTIRMTDVRIRAIAQGVVTLELSAVVAGFVPERRAHSLAVAVRGSEGWRIRSFHNMIPFTLPAQS